MKTIACTLAVLTAVFALTGLGMAELDQGTFSTKAFAWPERRAVPFSHERHVAATDSCFDCHHDYRSSPSGRANVFNGQGDVACASCHTVAGNGQKAQAPLRQAVHQSCQGCHERLAKGGKKAGPVACNSCHSKSWGVRHAG